LLFVINNNNQDAEVGVPAGKKELLSGKETGQKLTLGAFDVAVIELSADDSARSERPRQPGTATAVTRNE
jgi:hypothetical protein